MFIMKSVQVIKNN